MRLRGLLVPVEGIGHKDAQSLVHGKIAYTTALGENEMARDAGLEELVNDDLADVSGFNQKAMFGGWAWLLNGNLLCGARDDGLLVRLGKNKDAWALGTPGVVPMLSRGRRMQGWIRAAPLAYADDHLRHKLLDAALDFNCTLPAK